MAFDGVGKPVEFQINTPLDPAIIRRHIKSAMRRGLPEADPGPGSSINLVANGPSARGVVFEGPALCVNGAIGLFGPENPPALWAGCDPQEALADFLTEPSHETTYLVASKCHPAVFDRLKGYDVRLWHINDQDIPGVRQVPCAVSVTLCAMMLLHRIGWRKIDVWGWDCCFIGDQHHASTGALPKNVVEIELEIGDRVLKSTATWAVELRDALGILPVLQWCGTEVIVHGDGLIRAGLDLTPKTKELKSCLVG